MHRFTSYPRTKRIMQACRISERTWLYFVCSFVCAFCSAPILAQNVQPADSQNKVSQPTQTDIEFFERRVRPVLVEHCFKCHGPKKQESGLRLDSRAAILKGGDSGPPVELREPANSELIQAIRRTGDIKMPPKQQLKPGQVAALTKWVKLGLPWPKGHSKNTTVDSRMTHWSYQPIRDPTVPTLERDNWSTAPIDKFILAKLRSQSVSPSLATGRKTLLRRATFDLIGLPPTAEEIAAFEADHSADAFRKLVDRLLASPRHGERWGRYWLDVARYADNKGYVFFEEKKFPWAYTYRDYVVRAFNDDLPYDQFVMQQLAADQLELGGDKSPLTAMGFLTLGARFMNNLHDIIDDRIDVVTRGLMGLTVTCARCHDHKFDPIPQADYYSLYGVFRSSVEPPLPPLFAPPPTSDAYRKYEKEMSAQLEKLVDFVTTNHGQLVKSARKRAAEYLLAAHARRGQPRTDNFMLLTDKGSLNPTMVLRWQIYLEKSQGKEDSVWWFWHRCADFEPKTFAAQVERLTQSLNSDSESVRGLNPLIRQALRDQPPNSFKDVAAIYSSVLNRIDTKWQAALKQAIERGAQAPQGMADSNAEELREVLYGRNAPPDVPISFGWGFLALFPDRPTQAAYKKLLKAVESMSIKAAIAPARAMVLVDASTLHDPRIFLRGNPHRLGTVVPRQFLQVLSRQRSPFVHGSGRLELAQAIVDRSNPLTARVIVNRVWLHHFGTGLVQTPSDFGLRSEPPSHPELLDYLATRFVDGGWSLKNLHREIMLSATYTQGSDDRPRGIAVDPTNRLLWKMNRRRLDFEATRDAMLAVSGSLDSVIGGKPTNLIRGFVPRRTIYGFIDRMDLPGLLRAFDFPEPAATSPQRDNTTVAPQALYLMNSDFVREVARRLTLRWHASASQDRETQVARLYVTLFGRKPSNAELSMSHEFLGDKPSLGQWQQFSHALLMTNEFVFVD